MSSFTTNRLLLMAMAAVLLPIAMISAAPTQTTDFYNETTDLAMKNSTENTTMSPTQCYCNLAECKVTPDHYCITRLGCFYEIQPVNAPGPNTVRFPEIESHTVLVGGIVLNGVFGCLESLNERRTCNEILKSSIADHSEFPAVHSEPSSDKPMKITAYQCCESALCNNPSTISVAMKIVRTVQGTATFFFGSRDLHIDSDEQNNATISVSQSETTENTTVLLTEQSINKTILEDITMDIPNHNAIPNGYTDDLLLNSLKNDNSMIYEDENSTIASMAEVITEKDVQDALFTVAPVIKIDSDRNSTHNKNSSVTNSTTIEATSESIINHANEHKINTTQQDLIPETMANSSHNSELEPNSSSISNVNPIDKLETMETTSQVASSEPSTNQPQPLINSSHVPKIHFIVSSTSESNVLELNATSTQMVFTETTNTGETELVTTTSKITEENEPISQPVGHLIKKRHSSSNDTSRPQQLGEEPVVGHVPLPPEMPAVSMLPLEIDENINHQKNEISDPNTHYYNLDVLIGKTGGRDVPWIAIAIAIMSFVVLLVLVIIKIIVKYDILKNSKGVHDKPEKSCPRTNIGLQHLMSASAAHAFGPVGLFNGSSEFDFSNVYVDTTGDTTYVYTTIPARSSTNKPVPEYH